MIQCANRTMKRGKQMQSKHGQYPEDFDTYIYIYVYIYIHIFMYIYTVYTHTYIYTCTYHVSSCICVAFVVPVARLSLPTVDLAALRELLWSGAPEEDPKVRAESWQMLLGYLPPVKDRQPSGLQKKREEYEELRRRHYLPVEAEAPSIDVDAAGILRQIRLDIPRTSPGLPIFSHQRIQQLLERILFIWSVRHPASGYVQGINDLATPFVVVLLASELDCLPEEIDVDAAGDDAFEAVEAGSYWCLTKFLSDIQDHYTNGQPGIQQMVAKLREIVHRIDQKLYDHLEEQGLDFLQLSFRWMNCLLLREFPFPCVIRLWDTYISEPLEGFSSFHVYVMTSVQLDSSTGTAEIADRNNPVVGMS